MRLRSPRVGSGQFGALRNRTTISWSPSHSLYQPSYAGFTLHEIKKKVLFFPFTTLLYLSPCFVCPIFSFLSFFFIPMSSSLRIFSIFRPILSISCVNHSSSPRPFLFLSFSFSYYRLFSVTSFSLFFVSLSFF